MAAPGGAELSEQANQVGFGDAEFDVLSLWAFGPFEQAAGVVGEPVWSLTYRPDTDLVDPAAEVGGRGYVGAHGHDPGGHLGRAAP